MKVHDATCKNEVNFIKVWHEVLADYENDAIQKNLTLFAKSKEVNDALVQVANLIISTNAAGYFD
jgi:hypothetical protein